MAVFEHAVDCAFNLNPLSVFRAGIEMRKVYARRVRRQRGTADDTYLWLDNDRTKASLAADSHYIDYRPGEERTGQSGGLPYKDASGRIVNEDCCESGTVIWIEIGNYTA
jgi:hypothetical protein